MNSSYELNMKLEQKKNYLCWLDISLVIN